MRRHHAFRLSVLGLALGLSFGAARADTHPYRLRDVGPGYPAGVNANGDIAGEVFVDGEIQLHAAVWRDGVRTILSDAGLGLGSAANSVARDGTAVGWIKTADNVTHPVKWAPDGTRSALDATGAAVQVNARGTILGFDNPGLPFGWVIGPDGLGLRLKPRIAGETAFGNALNDHDWIVGNEYAVGGPDIAVHCVIWHDGQVQDLGFPPGATSCAANDINNQGHVVGTVGLSRGGSSAFLWRDGTWTMLGTLGGPSGSATALNDDDVVVGWASDSPEHKRERPFVWKDGVMTKLTDAFKNHARVDIDYLRGVDARGRIVVGTSPRTGAVDDEDVQRLVPIPAR